MRISLGTNYYLKIKNLYQAGKEENLYIGKSSFGWCFSLNPIPDLGLNSLEAWKNLIKGEDKIVTDEEGTPISKREIVRIITQRHHPKEGIPDGKRFMGLARCRIDGIRVIGHGKGTWDLVVTNNLFNPKGESHEE